MTTESTNGPLDGRTPKYRVEKHDGSPVEPGAKYLVVRIDKHGPAETAALGAYLNVLAEHRETELFDHLMGFFGYDAGRAVIADKDRRKKP